MKFPAICVAALLATSASAESHEYRVLFGGDDVGGLEVETDGDTSTIAFDYKQNGRGPTIAETLKLDESGMPSSWTITGRTTFGNPVNETYACADGRFVAFGSIEPQFYALLRQMLGVADDRDFDAQMDRAAWPALKSRVAAIIATRTRAQWCEVMEGTDICFAPVLSMSEAHEHPHNKARGTFVLDASGKVVYAETVQEVTEELNYDAALEAIKGQL